MDPEQESVRIERLVNSYWKTHELLFEGERRRNTFLRGKYGREVVNESRRIARRVARGDTEAYHELNDFVLRTGMTDDLPEVSLRGKETLRSLLTYLRSENEPFTLADLGSGDGRIAIGLAAYLDTLERLYAIDISPYARERMNANMLAQEEQETVRRKIVSLQGDYTSEEFRTKLFQYEPNGVDISLAAYPASNFEDIVPILLGLTKPEGKIVVCYPQETGNLLYSTFGEELLLGKNFDYQNEK